MTKSTASELVTYEQYVNIIETQITDAEKELQKYKSKTRHTIDLNSERVKLPDVYQNFLNAKPDLNAVLKMVEKEVKYLKYEVETQKRQQELLTRQTQMTKDSYF